MYLYDSAKLNLDEVVFEQRNKAYGAYAIRKSYPVHLSKGVLFTLLPLLLITVIGPLQHWLFPKAPGTAETVPVIPLPRNPVKDILELASGFTFILENPDAGFQIVRDHQVKEKPVAQARIVRSVEPLVSRGSGTVQTMGGGLTGTLPGIGSTGGGFSLGSGGSTTIHDFVEKMPEFPGGMDAMYAYIRSNLMYPKRAMENQIQGKVLVSFVVMPDGSVQQARIERSIGYGCDEEALRVVEQMPVWTAGIQNGNKVAVRLSLPLLFQIN